MVHMDANEGETGNRGAVRRRATQGYGGLRVKGDENTPPMKAVSTATQLCLFPVSLNVTHLFCLPGRQTEIPKEKEDQEK